MRSKLLILTQLSMAAYSHRKKAFEGGLLFVFSYCWQQNPKKIKFTNTQRIRCVRWLNILKRCFKFCSIKSSMKYPKNSSWRPTRWIWIDGFYETFWRSLILTYRMVLLLCKVHHFGFSFRSSWINCIFKIQVVSVAIAFFFQHKANITKSFAKTY